MSSGVIAVAAPVHVSVAFPATALAHGAAVAAAHVLVPVAIAAASVVAAGAVAVLATRAAAMGAEAAAGAVIRFDEAMKRDQQERVHQREVAELWQAAACAVAARKVRLSDARRRLGPDGRDLPRPLDMVAANTTLGDVHAWCRTVDAALAAAESAIGRRIDDYIMRRLRAVGRPGSPAQGGGAAAALALYRRDLPPEPSLPPQVTRAAGEEAASAGTASGQTDTATTPPTPAAVPAAAPARSWKASVEPQVQRIVHGVDKVLEEAALFEVLQMAGNVLDAADLYDAHLRLKLLKARAERLREAALQRSADREQAGRWLAALELPAIDARLSQAQRRTVAELRAVVDEDAPLDQDLSGRGAALARAAVKWADDDYLRAAVKAACVKQGYTVTDDAATTTLQLQGPQDWEDSHRATVMFRDGKLIAPMLHRQMPADDSERAIEQARCADHERRMACVAQDLAQAGFRAGPFVPAGVSDIQFGAWERKQPEDERHDRVEPVVKYHNTSGK